jgi:hypothetical protein
MKSVLFVSHSSADNALVSDIAMRIDTGTGSQCKTIVDVHDLRQGTVWSPQLYQWMAKCKAALLLLTENAIRSDWVLQEAIVLRARKVIDPKFPLFTVMPSDLLQRIANDPLLEARWKLFKPLDLPQIQGLQTFDPKTIADTVLEEMGGASNEDSYFDRLAGLLQDILRTLEHQTGTLSFLAGKMSIQDAQWQQIYGGNERLVDLVASHLCQGGLGDFQGLRDFFQSLKQVAPPDTLHRLLAATAFYWIDLGAAAAFAAAAKRAAPRLIAIRSSVFQDYSGALYIARYYRPHRVEPFIISLSGGNEAAGADDLEEQLLEAVRSRNNAYRKMPREKLVQRLKNPPESGAPWFVFVPEQHVEDVAFELATRYPGFVFVVPIADNQRARNEWTRCAWVQPDVGDTDELDRYADYEDARQLIEGG